MSEPDIQLVDLSSIIVPPSARSLDNAHAKKIARTIPPTGHILQAIGVVLDADRFRIVWGRHRLRAYELLSRKQIPARVLPKGTSSADEAQYSLLENSVHRAESFEDTLFRIEELSRRMNCSLREAAIAAEVKPAYLSRCQTAARKLSPKAKQFAAEHKLGISDVYLVASKATSPDMQLKALRARVAGKTRDELAHWFRVQAPATKRKSSASKKPKLSTLQLTHGVTWLSLKVPTDSTLDRVEKDMCQIHKVLFADRSIPIPLLQFVVK